MSIRDLRDDESYVVFASDFNRKTTQSFMLRMGIPYLAARGCYKGKQEDSFIIPARFLKLVLGLVSGQESILVLSAVDNSGRRPALLQYVREPHRIADFLGYFGEVPIEAVEQLDAYTVEPATGRAFACASL